MGEVSMKPPPFCDDFKKIKLANLPKRGHVPSVFQEVPTKEKGSSKEIPSKKRLVSFEASPRTLWTDRIAKWIICSFGTLIILAVALIIVFVGREAAPLFYSPTSSPKADFELQLPDGKV